MCKGMVSLKREGVVFIFSGFNLSSSRALALGAQDAVRNNLPKQGLTMEVLGHRSTHLLLPSALRRLCRKALRLLISVTAEQ